MIRRLATVALPLALALGSAAPASAIAFGANVHAPHVEHLQEIEADAGRQMDSTRVFLRWDSPWPHPLVSVKDRTRLMVSIQAMRVSGTRLSYSAIASARSGSILHADMVRWARRLRDLSAPITFTFNHEPEVLRNAASGTPAEYIAAWRKFRAIILAQGATNVEFSWIMTSHSFLVSTSDRRYAPKWYPGDAYIDIIAADVYNWYNCRTDAATPWRSLAYLIEGLRKFGQAHPGEAVHLAEWASVEDPNDPNRKAQWIRDAHALLKTSAYAQFEAVAWFAVPGAWEGKDCGWMPNSSTSALDAWREMGQDPYYTAP